MIEIIKNTPHNWTPIQFNKSFLLTRQDFIYFFKQYNYVKYVEINSIDRKLDIKVYVNSDFWAYKLASNTFVDDLTNKSTIGTSINIDIIVDE